MDITFTTPHEQFCYETAVMFSAIRGYGAKRTRQEFTSAEDAITYAKTFGDNKTMIYAINDLGNFAHIFNA